MDTGLTLQRFVMDYLHEIEAGIAEADGVVTATFPAGRKRRFGRERRFTFQPDKRRDGVELVEPGSPFLKLLLVDATSWGGLGVWASDDAPPGTRVYTFQLETYSSLKKRTRFLHAVLEPRATSPQIREGLPAFLERDSGPVRGGEVSVLHDGLAVVLPHVETEARRLSEPAVRESHAEFGKAVERVHQYFQGMRQETFLEEARIRKRLGEIQSKLYFTEDGLRELKLQQEQERLTHDLHALKQKNTQATTSIASEKEAHIDRVRRRHEPKLRIRLIGATLVLPLAVPAHGT